MSSKLKKNQKALVRLDNEDAGRLLIILSGPLCAGKSTLAACLRDHREAMVVTAREILTKQGSDPNDRFDLQARGAAIERATSGRWLVDGVVSLLDHSRPRVVIVDSVRTLAQANLFKREFSNCLLIHVTAAESVLRQRFLGTTEGTKAGHQGMAKIFGHNVERGAEAVRAAADLVIDTSAKSITDVCTEVLDKTKELWSTLGS